MGLRELGGTSTPKYPLERPQRVIQSHNRMRMTLWWGMGATTDQNIQNDP